MTRPSAPPAPSVALALILVASAAAVRSASPGPSTPAAQWREATPGYVFAFPRDHAAHPDRRIEWWYYTGNVSTEGGRRFGFQVTFFRVGVDLAPANPSRWAIRDLYMTHLAISDPDLRRYRHVERLNRAGPGVAGAAEDRYHVWNEGWSASIDDEGRHVLRAAGEGAALDLRLDEGKPPVVHGVNGISQKGAREGNASHYYSLTRMPTRGTVTVDGERFAVSGASWMDHEFGTSFLEPEQQGWDWLSLQMDDGRELMLYRLRRSDGRVDPRSSGTIVDAAGRATHLSTTDFVMAPSGPVFRSGPAAYPIGWTVTVPSLGLDLRVSTPLDNQELSLETGSGVSYWEGLIDAAGTARGRRVAGRGYLEMTGYRGEMGKVLKGSERF